MTREGLKQILEDKLKECNKDTLVDIIVDLCLVYLGTRAVNKINSLYHIQQLLNTIQTNTQEIITQKVNTNLYDTRK